jgi:predicted nucleic acid-binding protein
VIAIDTSSLIAFLGGDAGRDVEAVDVALASRQAALPPAVVSEALSEPKLAPESAALILAIPTLELREGYWERVGLLRARLLARGHRARLADALIAQSCLDHDVALVSRDRDFRHFGRVGGLRLL